MEVIVDVVESFKYGGYESRCYGFILTSIRLR